MIDRPLLLVGCGKMGGAMLEGWLEMGLVPEQIHIIEPYAPIAEELRSRSLSAVVAQPELPADLDPEIVLFAVKPQSMDEAAPALAEYRSPNTTFLSIAAGKTISYFENILGAEAAIVRSMPNTPAAVRRGITVAAPNTNVTEAQCKICGDLLAAVGDVAWVDDEGLAFAVRSALLELSNAALHRIDFQMRLPALLRLVAEFCRHRVCRHPLDT